LLPLGDKPPILGAAAFSPDSRLLAVVVNKFTVQLIDLKDFKSVGTLRAPGTTQRRGLAFSADGSRLAAVGPEARVGIWDLRELEHRMKQFGLTEEFSGGRP
jgi:WD40 repeat protein